LLALANKDGDSSTGVQLLNDIRDIFDKHRTDKMFSDTLAAELVKLEDRPWPEWGTSGKPLSKNQLARQLSKFNIKPGTVRINDETNKGYKLEQFGEAFMCYLDSQNVTTSQPAPDVDCSSIPKCHTNSDVTLCNPSQPAPVLSCDVVTFSKGGPTEEDTI
jgi:hypothetical protein